MLQNIVNEKYNNTSIKQLWINELNELERWLNKFENYIIFLICAFSSLKEKDFKELNLKDIKLKQQAKIKTYLHKYILTIFFLLN